MKDSQLFPTITAAHLARSMQIGRTMRARAVMTLREAVRRQNPAGYAAWLAKKQLCGVPGARKEALPVTGSSSGDTPGARTSISIHEPSK